MAKSLNELRMQLSAIEPDEHTLEGIGPDEVSALITLLDDQEAWLAARAVHALSRIDSDNARAAVVSAATSPRSEVRVAAATTAAELPGAVSDDVLARLLDDPDVGVRKFAVRSVSNRNSVAVRQKIQSIASSETNRRIRLAAEQKALA
jgi:HEAT repeat protein